MERLRPSCYPSVGVFTFLLSYDYRTRIVSDDNCSIVYDFRIMSHVVGFYEPLRCPDET